VFDVNQSNSCCIVAATIAMIYLFIYLFISALTLTTPATQIKTTKCQPRIERLQKEH